jgi:hypothetical protein
MCTYAVCSLASIGACIHILTFATCSLILLLLYSIQDGSGEVTLSELETGLRDLGVFAAIQQSEVYSAAITCPQVILQYHIASLLLYIQSVQQSTCAWGVVQSIQMSLSLLCCVLYCKLYILSICTACAVR